MKTKEKVEKVLKEIEKDPEKELKNTLPMKILPKINDKAIMKNDEDDELEGLFSSEIGNKPESVVQLFDPKNMSQKSRLTRNEISLVAILKYQAKLTGIEDLDIAVDNLVEFRASEDGKSRKEFVEGLQTKNDQAAGTGFIGKLGNVLGGKK